MFFEDFYSLGTQLRACREERRKNTAARDVKTAKKHRAHHHKTRRPHTPNDHHPSASTTIHLEHRRPLYSFDSICNTSQVSIRWVELKIRTMKFSAVLIASLAAGATAFAPSSRAPASTSFSAATLEAPAVEAAEAVAAPAEEVEEKDFPVAENFVKDSDRVIP